MSKLQNNFTTIEQSKRLLELGVPVDSADCCFYMNTNYSDNPHILYKKLNEKQADYDSPLSSIKAVLYPCWSVGRLMEIYHICIPNTSIYGWSYHEDVDYSYIDYIIQEYIDAYGELDFSKLEE